MQNGLRNGRPFCMSPRWGAYMVAHFAVGACGANYKTDHISAQNHDEKNYGLFNIFAANVTQYL